MVDERRVYLDAEHVADLDFFDYITRQKILTPE